MSCSVSPQRVLVLSRGRLIADGTPDVGAGRSERSRRSIWDARHDAARSCASVDAWYGAAQVVRGATLAVDAGEVVALIGRNGAGKTSLLRAIMGLMPRAPATSSSDGASIARLPPYLRARRGLGYVPGGSAHLHRPDGAREPRARVARPQPGGFRRRRELLRHLPESRRACWTDPASRMSGGEQQMLAVARTLAANPRVVLLDEPSEGIAPLVVARMKDAVQAMRCARRGDAAVGAEPRVRGRLADRAVLIEQGHIVGTATRDELDEPSAAVRKVLGIG